MATPSEESSSSTPIFQRSAKSNRRLSGSYVTGHVSGIQDSVEGSASSSATPRLGNLWQALRSVRTRTLFYSSLVAVIGSLSFGYANGFSSPTLPDLDKNTEEHTYFNKTVYHDLFNVSTYFIIKYIGYTIAIVFTVEPFLKDTVYLSFQFIKTSSVVPTQDQLLIDLLT